jgi:hypothetical protein
VADLNQLLQLEIAKLFGVTRMSVNRWSKEGMPKNPNGTYPGPACVAWLVSRVEERLEQQAEEGPETAESARWLAAFRRERYKLSKIERRQREGSLVTWAEVEKQWAARVALVIGGLGNLRDRLPAILQGRTRDEMYQIIKEEIGYFRDQYAKGGTYCPQQEIKP